MKKFPTILGSDFVVKTDYYPYTQSRRVLAKLDNWWSHDARKDNIRKDNYSLDPSLPSSVANSFDKKLVDGNFNFLYYKKEVFAYAGFQVVGNEGWLHRYTNNPFNDYKLFGAGTTGLVPLQIKWAKERGLDYYKVSFNEHNYKIYHSLIKKWYARGTYLENYDLGMKLMSRFDFLGPSEVNYTKQWVISLDLNRPDIDDFMLL
jgi:hypothetical protein